MATGQGNFSVEREYAFKSIELFKTETLGTGSYGAVCKAKCDELICAAKLLYPVLFRIDQVRGHRHPMERFKLECKFLSRISHPNIIQYLGTYHDPETNAPVLLMELMDESLTHFLESSPGDIPYHIQVDLASDIAQALAFLHTNEIIHRDLSSNNVLLLAGRAKVADFGMSKFATNLASMTTCPGTAVYMPPEALNTPPVYTEKLDIFSVGVVMLQIMTRLYPDPSDQYVTRELVDPQSPNQKLQAKVAVREIERRETHIQLIDIFNPILQIALDCLADQDTNRPTSRQLCQIFTGLKESNKYSESARKDKNQVLRERDELISQQNKIIADKEQELKELQGQTEYGLIQEDSNEKDSMAELREEVKRKDNQLKDAAKQLQAKNDQLLRKEATILELRAQLEERNRRAEHSHRESLSSLGLDDHLPVAKPVNMKRYKDMEEVQQVHEDSDDYLSDIAQSTSRSTPNSTQGGTPKLPQKPVWKRPVPACPSYIKAGSSTVCGNYAYFRGAGSKLVHRFEITDRIWTSISQHPLYGFTLVTIEDRLTTVGGFDRECSNRLYDLVDRNWVNNLPEMPIGSDRPAATYSSGHLIVAGGYDVHSEPMQSVNILKLDSKHWIKASSLPFRVCHASATVCNNKVYISAGDGQEHTNAFSVLSCSISDLVHTKRSKSLRVKLKKAMQSQGEAWRATADLPVFQSYLVNAGEQLIAIGGMEESGKSSNSIYKYDESNNSWVTMATMNTGRSSCLGAVFMENLLMVVGGNRVPTKDVEAITL